MTLSTAPAATPGTVEPQDPASRGGATDGYRIPLNVPQRPAHLLTTLADSMDLPSITAGQANVVMQLINAPVGYGVMESRVESGSLFKHPIKRSRTTFTYLAVAILGTADDKLRYREAVNTAHRQVRSTVDSPVKYNAMDRGLQLWVAMCLYIGFEDTHQLIRGRMSAEQRALFYRDSAPLGTTLQVPAELWPATPEAFDAKWIELCRTKITPTEATVEYLNKIIEVSFLKTPLPGPLRRFLRFQNAGFLAPAFREAMGIEWSAREQRRFEQFWRLVAGVSRFVPLAARQLPYRLLLGDMHLRARLGKPLV